MQISRIEMQEIAETATALIKCADADSFSALIIVPINGGGESTKHCEVAILPGLRAMRRELLMINDGFPHNEAERSEFFSVLAGLIEPLLEGVAKVRFVRHEALDRLIVLPLEPNEGRVSSLSHSAISFSTPESASPSA